MNGDGNTPRDLLGPWALNAVDDLERAAVERAIASDEHLAAEARQLRETISRLAEADAEEPPESLRDAVLEQIRSQTPHTGAGAGSSARGVWHQRPQAGQNHDPGQSEGDELAALRRRRRWQALAAAAAIVIAAAVPTAIALDQADRADQAELQAGQAQENAEQLSQALMDPAAEFVSDELPDGSRGVAVLGEDSALFMASDMTELQDQDYQLWVLHDDEAISAGLLSWDDGELSAQVEDFPAGGALAVTAEPIGGSEQPTTDPLLVLAGS